MTPVFADPFYFLALLSPADVHHAKAVQYATTANRPLLTTAWVLTEVADGMSSPLTRGQFAALLARLEADPQSEIIGPDDDVWRKGIDLYTRRADKYWSLTDCISFAVMNDRAITEALTGDHHFEQAGFVALMN